MTVQKNRIASAASMNITHCLQSVVNEGVFRFSASGANWPDNHPGSPWGAELRRSSGVRPIRYPGLSGAYPTK